MNDPDRSLLRTRIQHAKHLITEAEHELEVALGELRAGLRAEKVHAGERIERAFDALEGAKQSVIDLEALLGPEPAAH